MPTTKVISKVVVTVSAVFFLVGCAGQSSFWKENPEVNRGAQTNQKSSPDSGQSPAGDGLGGRGR